MRELVYLSEGKLRQFVPDDPPWWKKIGRLASIEAATPTGTATSLRTATPAGKTHPRAEYPAPPNRTEAGGAPRSATPHRTIADVAESAVWYTEPDLTAGQWIQFEVPMNRIVLRHSYGRHTGDPRGTPFVLFVDRPNGVPRRLLLHGSRQHMTGDSRPDTEVAPYVVDPSDGMFVADLLHAYRHPSDVDRKDRRGLAPGRRFEAAFERMTARLDDAGYLLPQAAEWVAGYARVTLPVSDRLLCATPLYVQRVPPP